MIYGLIAAIIQIITLTKKYRKWRNFAVPTVGIVGDLKDVTCNYNRKGDISSYRHHYALKIVHNYTTFNDVYTEDVYPDDEPLTYPGKKINILWSIRNQEYLDVDKTKARIKEGIKYVGIFAGTPILIIITIIIIDRIAAYYY